MYGSLGAGIRVHDVENTRSQEVDTVNSNFHNPKDHAAALYDIFGSLFLHLPSKRTVGSVDTELLCLPPLHSYMNRRLLLLLASSVALPLNHGTERVTQTGIRWETQPKENTGQGNLSNETYLAISKVPNQSRAVSLQHITPRRKMPRPQSSACVIPASIARGPPLRSDRHIFPATPERKRLKIPHLSKAPRPTRGFPATW